MGIMNVTWVYLLGFYKIYFDGIYVRYGSPQKIDPLFFFKESGWGNRKGVFILGGGGGGDKDANYLPRGLKKL